MQPKLRATQSCAVQVSVLPEGWEPKAHQLSQVHCFMHVQVSALYSAEMLGRRFQPCSNIRQRVAGKRAGIGMGTDRHRQTDVQTDRGTDRQTDRQTHRWTDR